MTETFGVEKRTWHKASVPGTHITKVAFLSL